MIFVSRFRPHPISTFVSTMGSSSEHLARYLQHDASRDPATRHGLGTRMDDHRATSSMPAAGKATKGLNAAFSACEYKPARLEPGRTFLLDDYEGRQCRAHRENLHLTGDACFQAMAYEKNVTQFNPVQESAKFHTGFYRRQQGTIRQDAERKQHEGIKEERAAVITRMRGDRMHATSSFAYNGYDIITGEDLDPSKDRGRRPEARHWEPGNELDHTERRDVGMQSDTAGGRLRDSTSRFFCTPQQMPHRQARQHTLETDGLTKTQRTSTVIGVGLNPAAEIKSIGVREAFTESAYAIRRRNSAMDPRTALGRANLRQASQANMQQSASHAADTARSADVAMVAALS